MATLSWALQLTRARVGSMLMFETLVAVMSSASRTDALGAGPQSYERET